jgi:hypothetical protein
MVTTFKPNIGCTAAKLTEIKTSGRLPANQITTARHFGKMHLKKAF